MPILGEKISSRTAISDGLEIPLRKFLIDVLLEIWSKDRGKPICELKLFGDFTVGISFQRHW